MNNDNPVQWLLKTRNLDAALLAHMGVKAVDLPGLGQAVAFPYRRNGERYADKFRTVDKNWRSTKDVTRGLYNADVLGTDPELPIVITEGEMDCLSVIQSGFDRCVSLPDGWTEKGNKTEALIEEAERLQNSPFVIVAGDNDRAGESLPKAIANLLKGQDVRFVTWPDGCKDANDVLMTYGEGEVASCLNKATRIDPPGGTISGFSDLPPMSHRRVLRTGNKSADQRFAFELGTMSVGTGIPGHGKSTLMTWLTHHVTRHENVRAGLIMFETHAHSIRDHLSLLSKGRAFDELSAPERKEAEADLDRRFRLVHLTFSDDTDHHLGWLESMVYTLAVREGCKFILIDPWNELEHLLEPGENMTNYVNFATRRIRQWAKALEVHICVLAHPKKLDVSRGAPRAPVGYDIADSAAFFNKPALGFTVHQEQTDAGAKFVRLITWKVRETRLYGINKGYSDFAFSPETMSYSRFDLSVDDRAEGTLV